jgi:hypothetical protein
MTRIAPLDPAHRHARHRPREYLAELDRRFAGGFDPAHSISAEAEELAPTRGPPVPRHAPRGLGIGRRLMAELEAHAAQSSNPIVPLETNEALTAAIATYRSAGYSEVAPFNDEPYAHHWFEKHLPRGRQPAVTSNRSHTKQHPRRAALR